MVIWQAPENARVPFLLKFNVNTQLRYLNTLASEETFTDSVYRRDEGLDADAANGPRFLTIVSFRSASRAPCVVPTVVKQRRGKRIPPRCDVIRVRRVRGIRWRRIDG